MQTQFQGFYPNEPKLTNEDIQFMRRIKNRAPSKVVPTQETKDRIIWQKEVV